MPREPLPDRRQAETLDLWHGGRRYHLTIGEFPDGRPGEIFLHGAKPGSDTDLLCDDIGVLISRLLQHPGDQHADVVAQQVRIRARRGAPYERLAGGAVGIFADAQVIAPAAIMEVNRFGLAPVGETFTGHRRCPLRSRP